MFYLGVDPGLRKNLGFAVLEIPLSEKRIVQLVEGGVLDLGRISIRVAASKLLSLCKRYGVSEAIIEDFLFFSDLGEGKREGHRGKASWFVVARMQRNIGFLSGFLSSAGVPVDVVSPSRWKKHVLLSEVESLLARNGRSANPHLVSAVGIVLGELAARKKDAFPSR